MTALTNYQRLVVSAPDGAVCFGTPAIDVTFGVRICEAHVTAALERARVASRATNIKCWFTITGANSSIVAMNGCLGQLKRNGQKYEGQNEGSFEVQHAERF